MFKYKYLIYKIYSWTASRKGDTPIMNAISALAFTHLLQLGIVLLAIDRLITPLDIYNIDKPWFVAGFIAYFALFYLLVYNKKKWAAYVEEYKDESDGDRRRGNILVISYLVGSILLFFLSLPILFSMGRP